MSRISHELRPGTICYAGCPTAVFSFPQVLQSSVLYNQVNRVSITKPVPSRVKNHSFKGSVQVKLNQMLL